MNNGHTFAVISNVDRELSGLGQPRVKTSRVSPRSSQVCAWSCKRGLRDGMRKPSATRAMLMCVYHDRIQKYRLGEEERHKGSI